MILLREKTGFTLVDLVVVIAILSVLAAVLFPTIIQQREKSSETTCFSNERQIGSGILQYAQEYDQQPPAGVNPFGGGQGWAGQIYPYIKRRSVFLCPSDVSVIGGGGHPSSYGYNGQITIPSPTSYMSNSYPTSYKLPQFAMPAKTVFCYEVENSVGYDVTRGTRNASGSYDTGDDYRPAFGGSAGGYGVGGAYDPGGYDSNAGTCGGESYQLKYATGYLHNSGTGCDRKDFQAPMGRHSKGANYVLADGHACFFLPSAVSGGYANPNDDYSGTSCGSPPYAAMTNCPDTTIKATFNLQ